MALLVHFTNQGLGEFLIQVPQTALGGGAMRGLRSSTRPFNLRTTIIREGDYALKVVRSAEGYAYRA